MKILRLIIEDKEETVIRDIKFNENGTSLIYGNILKPKNEKETSNSIGKTLLLHFIDYIYGANENSKVVKEEIHGWKLKAEIKYIDKIYKIQRTLGNSMLTIDDEKYELKKYNDFFSINRKLIAKQIFLSQKNNLVSDRSDPVSRDYEAMFTLLGINDLNSSFIEYCKIQDNIKQLSQVEKKILGKLNTKELKKLEEKIFLLKQSIKLKEDDLEDLNKRMQRLQVTKEKENVMNNYSETNFRLKKLQLQQQKLNIEYSRLKEFTEEAKDVDVPANTINLLFEKAEIEVPEMIKKRLKEVEEFQKKVFFDRKETTVKRLEEIEDLNETIEHEIKTFENELSKLAHIISQNNIFQESLAIYQKKSSELQELKFEHGELSKIENVILERKEQEDLLSVKYSEIRNIHNKLEQGVIEEYKTYIYNLVKKIYTSDVEAYFKIALRDRHKIQRPFYFDLNLTGDTGEGVGEVRKILIDLLVFNFNNILELMLQDSSCFSGIDNRQTSTLIKIANDIAVNNNKQYIVSLNDYQFNKNDKEFLQLVSNSTIIELNESNKLLNFNF